MPKLVSITRSDAKNKKWKAIFDLGDGKKKTINFGQSGAEDFTIGASEEKRKSYRARHSKGAGSLSNAMSAKALSYYVLWGDSKSRTANIASYKRRFNL
tara:strand:+ start:40 stop:336 length:297 start_codon:yes stop_codon:yes gene_type:complete